ncbi:MAG: hypothetical protein IT288_04385 [Bdellovibrionales bacterium]|nr:hypothetical protein [Bdellovibrionales bacterium]
MRQLAFILLLYFAQVAWAQPPATPQIRSTDTNQAEQSFLEQADVKQQKLSRSLANLSNSIDSFFGNTRIDEESASKSRIRINLISALTDGEGDSYDANIRTRIALPNTERKLNLVVQNLSRSFTEDQESGQAENIAQSVDNEDLGAALRYQPESDKEWSVGTDAGIKLVSPLDPFVRFRVRRSWWPGAWEIRATETVFWFKSEGYGHTESLDFDRPLNADFLFRFANQASWRRLDLQYQFDHSLNLFQRVSDRLGIAYFVRMHGSDVPAVHVESYATGVNFRRRIHKEWLFFNIQPGGSWPREENFTFVASISFKLEVIIGQEEGSVAAESTPPRNPPDFFVASTDTARVQPGE